MNRQPCSHTYGTAHPAPARSVHRRGFGERGEHIPSAWDEAPIGPSAHGSQPPSVARRVARIVTLPYLAVWAFVVAVWTVIAAWFRQVGQEWDRAVAAVWGPARTSIVSRSPRPSRSQWVAGIGVNFVGLALFVWCAGWLWTW